MITIVSADGTRLAARRTGDGPPLVLVHGSSGGIDSFAPVEPLLARRRSVWVYDRRGRGASGDTLPHSLAREVEDLQAVLGAAGGPADVVGHSFGGVVCLAAASGGAAMRSLVVYEPPLNAGRVDRTPLAEAARAVADGDTDRALLVFFEQVADIPAGERDALLTIPPVRARLLDGMRAAPREFDALIDLDWSPGDLPLPPGLPTLLLSGELTGSDVYADERALRASVPQLRAGALSGQRHLAMAFAPDAFAAAVLEHVDGA